MMRTAVALAALAALAFPAHAEIQVPYRCVDAVLKDLENGDAAKAGSAGFLVGGVPGTSSPNRNQIRLPDLTKHKEGDLGKNASTDLKGNGLCDHGVWYRLSKDTQRLGRWNEPKKPDNTAAELDADKTKARAKVLREIADEFVKADKAVKVVETAAEEFYQALEELGAVDGGVKKEQLDFQGRKIDVVRVKLKDELDVTPAAVGDDVQDPARLEAAAQAIEKKKEALLKIWKAGHSADSLDWGSALAAFRESIKALADELGVRDDSNQMKSLGDVDIPHYSVYANPDLGWLHGKDENPGKGLASYDLILRNKVVTHDILVAFLSDSVSSKVKGGYMEAVAALDAAAKKLRERSGVSARMSGAASALQAQMFSEGTELGKLKRIFDNNRNNTEWLDSDEGRRAASAMVGAGAYKWDKKTKQYVPGDGIRVVQEGGKYKVMAGDKVVRDQLDALPEGDAVKTQADLIADKIVNENFEAGQVAAMIEAWKPYFESSVPTGDPSAEGDREEVAPHERRGGGPGGPGGPGRTGDYVNKGGGPGTQGCDSKTKGRKGYEEDLAANRRDESIRMSGERQKEFDRLLGLYETEERTCNDRRAAAAEKERVKGSDWRTAEDAKIEKECDENDAATAIGKIKKQMQDLEAQQKLADQADKQGRFIDRSLADKRFREAAVAAVAADADIWKKMKASDAALAKKFGGDDGIDAGTVDDYFGQKWATTASGYETNLNALIGAVEINTETRRVDPATLESFIEDDFEAWVEALIEKNTGGGREARRTSGADALRGRRGQFAPKEK